jgi:serine/threonine protein kinase
MEEIKEYTIINVNDETSIDENLIEYHTFSIPNKCLTDNNIDNIGNKIACGSYACVYEEKGESKNNVIKIIIVRQVENYITDIINEIKITKLASDNDISPKLIKYFDYSGYSEYTINMGEKKVSKSHFFFIVSEKYDITLKEYIKSKSRKNIDRIIKMLKKQIIKLHEFGIVHNDLHTGNVMLKLNDKGDIIRLVLIDFGQAKVLTNIKDENIRKNLIKWDLEFIEYIKNEYK